MAARVNVEDVEQVEQKFQEETYERLWIVPDWDRIQRSETELMAQYFVLETGKLNGVQTKWKLGFKFFQQSTQFRPYWKLIEAKGFPDEKLQASTNFRILKGDSHVYLIETPKETINLGQVLELTKNLPFNSDRWNGASLINPDGELTIKLRLTVVEPYVPSADLKTELFHKVCFEHARSNFVRLLEDKTSTDLTILTSDGKELFAHKMILKVQCPVFESMFRSDLSENKSGIVTVKDVKCKTMGIFLHFFYTGELQSSWQDDDTVVEFTYAVGKYQLTNVLKFLDEVLGTRKENESFQIDVQLLDLARKLHLKTAEKELLARIKKAVCKVSSADEYFILYGK